MKEHKKLCQKQVSKVMLHFVWGHLSKKQTVVGFFKVPDFGGEKSDDSLIGNSNQIMYRTDLEIIVNHWRPQFHFCNPCHRMGDNLPNKIINLEDFNTDAKCFLDSLKPRPEKEDYRYSGTDMIILSLYQFTGFDH